MKYFLVHCVFLCCLTSFVFAANPDCTPAEFRQLDFWVGEWIVTYPDGRPAGNSVIQKILNGCVILENWSGAGDLKERVSTCMTATRKNGFRSGSTFKVSCLNLKEAFGIRPWNTARYTTLDRKNVIGIMTFTPSPDGTIRQIWKQSTDEGKTWKVEFDGIYKRKEK